VLVYHDLLGMEDRVAPRFVRRYASLQDDATAAMARFADDVRSGRFPSSDETYHMTDQMTEALDLYGDGSGVRRDDAAESQLTLPG
jgi:3-methyl-2-oxobutanoate hydroxymethyltransferase